MTEGGPLSAKLFNILVDAVAREWVRQLWEKSELEEAVITELMAAFFAIFYIDNAYLASRDPEFLQRALDFLVNLFACVGLKTNVKKTQTIICMPGRIQIQLPAASYARMREGLTTAEEWDSRKVQCHQCNKMVAASSLRRHLADQHKVYQKVVVAEELLGARAGMTYHVHPELGGRLKCPVPGCAGKLRGGWMLWQYFRDLHPLDKVVVSTEGYFLGVNGVQCRLTLCTPDTSGHRSARPGWSGSYKENQRYVRHWPYAASSQSMGMCWNAIRNLSTSVVCLRRVTTMHRLFNNSCKKHGEYGLVWGKCYAGKTLPQGLLLNATKQ
jgi:hypothetical protein